MNGSASGFSSTVCISAPARASAAPTSSAMIATGRRTCQTITSADRATSPQPVSAPSVSAKGSPAGPVIRSATTASSATASIPATSRTRRRLSA